MGSHLNRRARVISINSDEIQKLSVAKYSSQIWYDKDMPFFAVRKDPSGIRFFVVPTQPMRHALLAFGKDGSRQIKLKETDPGKARILAQNKWQELTDLQKKHSSINAKDKKEPPEAILEAKEPNPNPNYDSLMSVLMDAYSQAANGKGTERHNPHSLNFEDQDMLKIMDRVGQGFALGQAIKKLVEGNHLPHAAARHEFLGAIVYIAGCIVWHDQKIKK